MKINLILIPFVIVLGLLFANNDNKKNRKLYIMICSAVLVFVAAMRSPVFMTDTYGIDTANYYYYFQEYSSVSWSEFWSLAYQRYFGNGGESDIGFIGFVKMIGWFTNDFYIYSILADLIFFVPLGIILYRYCTSMPQIIFAFVFYIALVQIFFIGGGRQMFAMGFDLMAFIAIINKKKLRTVVLFLVGVTIHFSSILFLMPLLMIWYGLGPKKLKSIHVVVLLLFPVVFLLPNGLIVTFGNLVRMEKYAEYGLGAIRGGSTTFIILIEILSVFLLIAIKKRDFDNNDNLRLFYVMVPFFSFFAPLVRSNGTMIRISLYYYLFLMLLVPFGIDCMFKEKNNGIVYSVAITALAIMALSNGGIRYYFYWQI